MENTLTLDLSKALSDTKEDLKNLTTHCFDLNCEIMKLQSPHFNKVDMHFEGDGLLCTYECNLDGKKYSVMITPQKG